MRFAPVALAALALPSAAPAQTPPPALSTDAATLSLSVTERIEAEPDLAIVGGGVTTLAPTATAALRQNSDEMAKVIAAVRRAGIAEADVQTTGINLSAQYDYSNRTDGQPPRFTGYQASNRVELRVHDIARLGAILDSLVTAGATDISGPSFTLDNSDALEAQARLRTIATGQARADAYARAAGFRAARLTGISETGSFAPDPIVVTGARMQSMAARDVPVSPGRVRQAVTVSFTYRLER